MWKVNASITINKIEIISFTDRIFGELCMENDIKLNTFLFRLEVRCLLKIFCLNKFYKILKSTIEFWENHDNAHMKWNQSSALRWLAKICQNETFSILVCDEAFSVQIKLNLFQITTIEKHYNDLLTFYQRLGFRILISINYWTSQKRDTKVHIPDTRIGQYVYDFWIVPAFPTTIH